MGGVYTEHYQGFHISHYLGVHKEHYQGVHISHYQGVHKEHYQGVHKEHYQGVHKEHYQGIQKEHYQGVHKEHYQGIDKEHYQGVHRNYYVLMNSTTRLFTENIISELARTKSEGKKHTHTLPLCSQTNREHYQGGHERTLVVQEMFIM